MNISVNDMDKFEKKVPEPMKKPQGGGIKGEIMSLFKTKTCQNCVQRWKVIKQVKNTKTT